MEFKAEIDTKAADRISKKILGFETLLTSKDVKKIGEQSVIEIKGLISKGISPIQKFGRFAGYRGSYKERIRKTGRAYAKRSPGAKAKAYPKKLRPVNLFVSGHQMKSLQSWTKKVGRSFVAVIGYKSKFAKDKEEGHRKGHNRQAKRPTIPDAPRESFARRIQDIYLKYIDNAIKLYIRKR